MSLGERSLLQALQGLASKQMHGALSRRLQDLAEHLPTDKTDVKDVLYKVGGWWGGANVAGCGTRGTGQCGRSSTMHDLLYNAELELGAVQ